MVPSRFLKKHLEFIEKDIRRKRERKRKIRNYTVKIRDTYADARVHFVILVDQANTWIKVY